MDPAKKDTILVEAARAFAQFGFKKASVDEIAKAAGVAKGTIYLACSSKEDLFYQVVHREVRAWQAEVAKTMDPRVSADELLVRMAHAGIAYMDARPLVRDLLFGKTAELLPRWSERFDDLRAVATTNVIEVLRLGIRQGIFRPEIDVEAIAVLLQDIQLATYIFHNRGPNRDERLERRRAAASAMIFHGIRVPGGVAQIEPR